MVQSQIAKPPPPLIAGVGTAVGTSTLAAALRGVDCGIYQGRGAIVDVLVARSSMYSLGCAQRALAVTAEPPVLAVVGDAAGVSLSGNAKARLRMTEPYVAAVVMVPFVARWHDVDDPRSDAANVLLTAGRLPKHVRGFAAALHELAAEITPLVNARVAQSARPAAGTEGGAYPMSAYPDPVPAGFPGTR